MKKTIAFLLTVAMLLSLLTVFPLTAFAEGNITDSGSQEGVGYGFDARNSNLSKPSFTQGKIAEVAGILAQNNKSTVSTYLSSSTILEMTDKYSESLNISVGLDIPISKVNLGIEAKFSSESSSSTGVKKSNLYEMYYVSEVRQTISIDGYDGDISKLTFSEGFSDKISALETAINQGDTTKANKLIDQLFDYYGTHLVTSYYLGGRLEATNHISSEETLTEEQLKTASELKVDIGAGKLFNVSGSIGMTTDEESITKTDNTEQCMMMSPWGGIYPSITELSSMHYASWQTSLEDVDNLQAIGFVNDNSLVGVWELIEDAATKAAVKSRYLSSVQGYYYQTPSVEVVDPCDSSAKTSLAYTSYVRIDETDESTRYVAPNSKVYFDIASFSEEGLIYAIVEGSSFATINEKDGILTVNGSTADGAEIKISVKTESGLDVCSITFIVKASAFSGGYGTEYRPFLLSTPTDIVNLANNSTYYEDTNYHYLLTNSIDMDAHSSFNGIAGEFCGVLDGNGFAIYHFEINGGDKNSVGFIYDNLGTVKNLTIGTPDFSADEYGGYSASIYSSRKENTGHTSWVGGIAGRNMGEIVNCRVENVKILGNLSNEDDVDNTTAYCDVGGIVGANGIDDKNGKISECYVTDVYLYSDMPIDSDGGDNNHIKIGGISAINNPNSIVDDSIVESIKVYAYAHGDGYWIEHSHPEIMAGGIVGSNSGVINNSISYEIIEEKIYVSSGGYTSGEKYFGGAVGYNHRTVNNCYTSVSATSNAIHGGTTAGCSVADVATIGELFKSSFFLNGEGYLEIDDISSFSVDIGGLNEFVEGDSFSPCGLEIYASLKSGTRKNDATEAFAIFDTPQILEKGENTVHILSYGNTVNSFTVEAGCAHNNSVETERVEATCDSVGYTAGIYCNDCAIYVSGHIEIPVLSEHPFGNWTKVDDDKHVRKCACGETEDSDHKWNDGVETVAPTYGSVGEMTYTCKDCGATETEVIPKLEIDENATQLVVSSKNAIFGSSVTVPIVLKNNPGIAGIVITLSYDTEALGTPVITNGEILSTMQGAVNIVFYNDTDSTADGTLATLTFTPTKAGEYEIGVTVRECTNIALDDVEVVVVDGTLTVLDFVYGDADGNNKVNLKDAVLLATYLANYDYDTGTSSVELQLGADANGDGKINLKDAVLVATYIANYDYDTGSSTVVLGPVTTTVPDGWTPWH